jgi:hypothetical protein
MMLDRTRYDPEPRRRRAPPAGYETLGVDWDRLTPTKTAIVCAFADALREIRRNELELLRLGTTTSDQCATRCASCAPSTHLRLLGCGGARERGSPPATQSATGTVR